MKKIGLLLTATLAMVLVVASVAFAGFKDVPANHWAYDELEKLQEMGIVEGYPGGYFKGDNTLTRYEMAVLVYRLYNQLKSALETGKGVDPEARAAIERLANEFRDELEDLGARIDNLEGQVQDNTSEIAKLKELVSTKGTVDYTVMYRAGYFIDTPDDNLAQDVAQDWAMNVHKSFKLDEWTSFDMSLTYGEDQGFGISSVPGGNNEFANPNINPGFTSPSSASFIVDTFYATWDLHRIFPNFADSFTATLGRQYFSLGEFGLAGDNGYRSNYGLVLSANWDPNWEVNVGLFRLESATAALVPAGGAAMNQPYGTFGSTARFGLGGFASNSDDFDYIQISYSSGTGTIPGHEDQWGASLVWVPEGAGYEHYIDISAHTEIKWFDEKWLNGFRGEWYWMFENINDQDPNDPAEFVTNPLDGFTNNGGVLELDIYNDGNTKFSFGWAWLPQLEGLPAFANVDNDPFSEFEVTTTPDAQNLAINVSRYGKNYFPADFVGGGISWETTWSNKLYTRLTAYLGSRIDAIADDRPAAARLEFRYPWTKSTTLGLDIITAGTTDNFSDSATQLRGWALLNW